MREWTQRHIEELIDKHAGQQAAVIPPLANFSHWPTLDTQLFNGSQVAGSSTLSVMLGSEKVDLQGTVDFLSIGMRMNTSFDIPRGELLDAALPRPRAGIANPVRSRYEWRVLDEARAPWVAPLDSGTVLNAATQTVLQDHTSAFDGAVSITTQQVDGGGSSDLSVNGNRRALVFRFGDNWNSSQIPSNIIAGSGGGQTDLYLTCIRVNGELSPGMLRLCPLRTT